MPSHMTMTSRSSSGGSRQPLAQWRREDASCEIAICGVDAMSDCLPRAGAVMSWLVPSGPDGQPRARGLPYLNGSDDEDRGRRSRGRPE